MHADKVRENRGFYEDWLLPKVQHYCRTKGWVAPRVSSLGDADGDGKGDGKEVALKG